MFGVLWKHLVYGRVTLKQGLRLALIASILKILALYFFFSHTLFSCFLKANIKKQQQKG